MSRLLVISFVAICLTICGCTITSHTPKYAFVDGYYHSKLDGKKGKKYYIVTGSDSIKVYPGSIQKQPADTSKSITFLFPPHLQPKDFDKKIFQTQNFDLDIVTVIFKYRPTLREYPAQLNTNFNGALYGGYRKDFYSLSYTHTPFHIANRQITHHGYSVGGFAGLGASRIDEFVTLNRINYEYDGVVFTTGVATELNLDKINFVILSGLDFLTDRNSHVWVNNRKIWAGVGIGLNLN